MVQKNLTEQEIDEEILQSIAQYNKQQTVLNDDRFEPLGNDSLIVVVQVHDRIDYLKHLIGSLAQAKDISKILLIFSHDIYDDRINDLVRSINFCRVLQIFYPYSIQTYPHQFPGTDPNDCPHNITREEAIIRKCNNALHPDSYGHYREAHMTQIKHHWWWKANRIFDQLDVSKNHDGLVLFLEEDLYMAEDFVHFLALMRKSANEVSPACNILTIGGLSEKQYDCNNFNKFTLHSGLIGPGFAFDRSTWRDILHCANLFCTYDDYNWDWTLQYLSQKCLNKPLWTMLAEGPRLFHIGECGFHYKQKNCDPSQVLEKVQGIYRTAKESSKLYPANLTVAGVVGETTLLTKDYGWGSWGDERDHNLCLKIAMESLKRS